MQKIVLTLCLFAPIAQLPVALQFLLHAPPVRSGGALRVVTLNMHHGSEGTTNIVAALKKLNPDIIALQEVDKHVRRSGRVDQARFIAEELGMKHVFCKHFDFDGGEYGLALISRYDMQDARRIKFTQGRAVALFAKIRAPGRTISVINMHLQYSEPDWPRARILEAEQIRLAQAGETLRFARAAGSDVIVLGDMNALDYSEEYALFARLFHDPCACSSRWWNRTWPAPFPTERLDYIWIPRSWQVSYCATLPGNISDHFPVVLDVTGP